LYAVSITFDLVFRAWGLFKTNKKSTTFTLEYLMQFCKLKSNWNIRIPFFWDVKLHHGVN